MNKLTRFFKTSAIYFVGNVLSKLVAFFLLPLYTKYISPEQYGEYDLVLTFINLVAPVAFFQIWDGMFRYSFDSDKVTDKYKVINNATVVFATGLLFYVVLFGVIYHFYHFSYWQDAIIYGVLFAIHYISSFAARIFMDNVLFVTSGIVNTLLTAIINIVLIVVFNWDVRSLYVSASIGCVAQILMIEAKLKLLSHFKVGDIEKKVCQSLLKFSFPLCLATISYWLLSGFTRVSIVNNLGNSENGQFAVASRFASMITIIVNVFQFAWNEIAYLMSGDMNRKEKYSESIKLLFRTIVIGSALLCIIIKPLYPLIIDSQYNAALNLVPVTIMGVAFNSMAGFLGTFFMAEKSTNHILYTTLIVAILNCTLCYIFIEKWGLMGAASVLTVSFFILMILRLFILSNKFEVKYNFANLFFLVVYFLTMWSYLAKITLVIDIALILLFSIVYIVSVKKYIYVYILKRKVCL